jgi:hypothetical protein
MTAAKPQKSSCRVEVFIRLTPKFIANTKPSGARMMIQPIGLMPVPALLSSTCPAYGANSRATMPVSSTPDAM